MLTSYFGDFNVFFRSLIALHESCQRLQKISFELSLRHPLRTLRVISKLGEKRDVINEIRENIMKVEAELCVGASILS